ncbi:DUF2182 domain-containing protein [Ruegeria sp. HKCCD6228]|uniref:DUF2182 domain-containing protein n=1 Tax=unclassified Ruegeria TaxID=2625375 RepID=UPI0014876AD1|nr:MULTISPECIES: DUF2182 domain-containing protein [unclassified Ruegeria]NOD98287.1 DUF2182 domain-containing protein [Ruegeria sp. HKCCD6228]
MTKQNASPRGGTVEWLLRQDSAIVLGSVLLIILGATWYTIAGVGMNMSAVEMTRMAGPVGDPMQMGPAAAWSASYALLIFLMWWVMMIAMMTPSAAPAVLLFIAVKRTGPEKHRTVAFSLWFLSGYLVAWGAFSLIATALQWGLEQIGLSDGPMMTISSGVFAGSVLLAAGAYQFSALKNACLRHCQSPARFLANHNRPGTLGAFRTGILHGTYCLGCCWALMLLLFVGGIMNLYWIVGIAAYVALEKLLPGARWLVPVTGSALIGAGLWFITAPLFSGT